MNSSSISKPEIWASHIQFVIFDAPGPDPVLPPLCDQSQPPGHWSIYNKQGA
jgi:hypothetical protein